MIHAQRSIAKAVLLIGTAALCMPSLAQTGTGTAGGAGGGYSLLPGTTGGYVGLHGGRSDYQVDCGPNPLFGCDRRDTVFKLTTGGLLTPYFGLELGYLHFGNADRAGGRTRAQGFNLSAIGKVPLGAFSVYAKLGTTYGRTRTTTSVLGGVDAGDANGWGGSYGIGAGYDFTPNLGVVVELERHQLRFAGVGRERVEAATIGVLYRF